VLFETLLRHLALMLMTLTARSPYPPPGSRPESADRERERRAPITSSYATTSPPALLSDLDPENVSRELKKEGSDWFAVWSSQSKKQLEISLVHTLSHETYVFRQYHHFFD
jgi:glucose repression regulatory protein TUP1